MAIESHPLQPQLDMIDHVLAQTRIRFVLSSIRIFFYGIGMALASVLRPLVPIPDGYEIFYWLGAVTLVGIPIGLAIMLSPYLQAMARVERTHRLEEILDEIWMVIGLSVFFAAFAMPALGVYSGSAITPVLAMQFWGLNTISGRILRHPPMVLGGQIWLVVLGVGVFLPEYNYYGMALGFVAGMAIPTWMLRRELRNSGDYPEGGSLVDRLRAQCKEQKENSE